MTAVIFTLIASHYLINPVQAGAAAGIAFITPGGITVARVGFAAFPLTFALIALRCVVAERRILSGLYMVVTLVTIVIGVRLLGMALQHSVETAKLLVPETALMGLSLVAIRLERARLK